MKIQTTAHNLNVTSEIQSYLDKRLSVLEKFLKENENTNVRVILSKDSNHHRHGDIFSAEVNMHIGGENIFAKTEQESLFAAIDIVKDEIAGSLRHRKDRKETMFKKGHRKVKQIMRGLKF
jgi:putative sigma-54 modulation protein